MSINRLKTTHNTFLALAFLAMLSLVSCDKKGQTKSEAKDTSATRVDSTAKDKTKVEVDTGKAEAAATTDNKSAQPGAVLGIIPKAGDRFSNDAARLLGGLKQEEGSDLKKFEDTKAWVTFKAESEGMWARYNRDKKAPRIKWAEEEIADLRKETKVLFYPFSGPDFLNAATFFPNADKIVMIGLESPGTVPNFRDMPLDSLSRVSSAVKRTLRTIMSVSFFKTLSMRTDLKSTELDGTLPIILLFMARTDHTILNVRAVQLSAKGEIMDVDTKHADARFSVKGNEVTFKNKEGVTKVLYYFSADVNDNFLKKRDDIIDFVKSLGTGFTTYIKSASYLMHDDGFSNIRSRVLEQSKYVFQDDSGVPFRFYNDGKWELTLFGTYDKPIDLFKYRFQKDLLTAYTDSAGTKHKKRPLPFGIGYDYRANESNLILATKKE